MQTSTTVAFLGLVILNRKLWLCSATPSTIACHFESHSADIRALLKPQSFQSTSTRQLGDPSTKIIRIEHSRIRARFQPCEIDQYAEVFSGICRKFSILRKTIQVIGKNVYLQPLPKCLSSSHRPSLVLLLGIKGIGPIQQSGSQDLSKLNKRLGSVQMDSATTKCCERF